MLPAFMCSWKKSVGDESASLLDSNMSPIVNQFVQTTYKAVKSSVLTLDAKLRFCEDVTKDTALQCRSLKDVELDDRGCGA